MAVEVAKRITARQGNLRAAFSLLDIRRQEWIDGATMIALFLAVGRYRYVSIPLGSVTRGICAFSRYRLRHICLFCIIIGFAFCCECTSGVSLLYLLRVESTKTSYRSWYGADTYLMFEHGLATSFWPSINEEISRSGLTNSRSFVMSLRKRFRGCQIHGCFEDD